MTDRWTISDEVKEKYTPIIQEFIDKLESATDDLAGSFQVDFSDTELNPYTLKKLLEGLGYQDVDMDSNGWQMDYWITMSQPDRKTLLLKGTGITFELKLTAK